MNKERTSRIGGWKRQLLLRTALCTAIGGTLAALPAHAQTVTLPSGGHVVAGSATIGTPSGGALAISQSSDKAIIDWNGFSIGAGGTMRIDNGTGATLNRVTGTDISSIDGLLSATGSVYLLNPNGVIIGKQGVVDVGGSFVASTLDASNAAFMKGGDLTLAGPSSAAVVNLGHIGALGGDVVLAAYSVANRGSIDTPAGTTGLLAGHAVMLADRDSGDGRFSVLLGGAGSNVTNTGAIAATAAELRANGGSIYALAGNTRGIIRATGVANQGGRVFLTTGAGGTIQVAGTDITASGPGAAIRIGSADTAHTTIADGVSIATDAGGFIETSGADLTLGAARVDAGQGGTWLLDPVYATIDAAAAASLIGALDGGGDVEVDSMPGGAITVAAPIAWSADSTLTLDAAGNIIVNAPITATGANAGLILTYGGALNLHAAITLSGANAALAINGANYTLIHDADQLQAMQNSLAGDYALGNDIDASATGSWNGGAGFAPVGNDTAPFSGTLNGLGHVVSGLVINRPNAYYVGLFGAIGIGGGINDLGLLDGSIFGYVSVGGLAGENSGAITGSYATGTVLGGAEVGGLVGRNFNGTVTASYATGAVSGNTELGGLAGYNAGVITDSYANGAMFGTDDDVGGLVGDNSGAIYESYATGSVVGTKDVGGLAGTNGGAIYKSYATGAASGTDEIGGLVGVNYIEITDSYATGTVSGHMDVGALIGANYGVTTASFFLITRLPGCGNSCTAGGATGLTTAQMQDPFTFIDAGWDFAGVWSKSKSGANGGNMMLRAFGGDLYDYFARVSDATKSYGDANPRLTIDGPDAGKLTVDWGAAITTATDAGSYAYGDPGVLALSYATGSASDYYVDLTGALTVTPRPITISAADLSKIYGNPDPALTYSIGGMGLVNGDTLSGALARVGGEVSGDYAIGQGDLAASANYALTFDAGTLTVTARPITIIADDLNRIYGDANPALTYAVGGMGLVNGDTLSGVLETNADARSGVGGYDINLGTLGASGNYTLTFDPGTLTVTPRPITITATDLNRIYGDANPALAWQISTGNLVNGDTLTGALETGADARSDVGNYAITQGGLNAGGNYTLTFDPGTLTIDPRHVTVAALGGASVYGDSAADPGLSANNLASFDTVSALIGLSNSFGITGTSDAGSYSLGVAGTLSNGNYVVDSTSGGLWTVTARPISITAVDLSRIYGAANPALTYAVGGMGLVNGDMLSGALGTGTDARSDVGDYAITQGTLDAGGNYSVTFDPGTLTVDPRHLTVTALGGSSIYGDGGTNPGLSASNLASFDDVSALTGLSNDFAITGTNDAGSYKLNVAGTLTNGNYVVDMRTAGSWTVTARPISITAVDLSRIYGDVNPTLTYTVGGLGLVNGDTLSGMLATSADARSNVGDYAVTQGGLDAGGNYALTFTSGTLTIDPRHVTVTALGGSSIYGDGGIDPGLSARNLAGFDTVSALTGLSNGFGITGASDVGNYTLGVAGALTNANYVVDMRTVGSWTVTPRSITISAADPSRIYGDTNPALTYAIGGMGLVNGDALSGALTTSADATSDVGDYAIGQGSLAASANYLVAFDPGMLTITPRPIVITADDLSKLWGRSDPPLTYTIGGMGLANGDTLSGMLARAAGETPGVYAIGQGSLAASANYAVRFTPGALTIAPVLIEGRIPLDPIFSPPPPPPLAAPPAQSCPSGPCLTPYPGTLNAGSPIQFAAIR